MFVILLFFVAIPFVHAADHSSLPPDPGEAGKATLAGIDSDGDGVRDDVQRWIATTYPNSEKIRAALRQLAQDYQRFILGNGDAATIYNAANLMNNTNNCLSYIDFRQAYSWGQLLKAKILIPIYDLKHF